MPTSLKKKSTATAAAHYAIYIGVFWIFEYLFLMGSEYNDVYKYIYNILNIGTPILFYALCCVYRDKILGGTITFGKVIAFGVLLFLFASFLEAVIISINILLLNPSFLSNLQEQVFLLYEQMHFSEGFIAKIRQNFQIDPITFIVAQVISNVFIGLLLSLLLGYFISNKKTSKNQKPQ